VGHRLLKRTERKKRVSIPMSPALYQAFRSFAFQHSWSEAAAGAFIFRKYLGFPAICSDDNV